MLSDDDKTRIEAEESAKIAAQRESELQAARVKALEQYRASVKTLLKPTPRRSSLRWLWLGAVALLPIGAIIAVIALPKPSPVTEDSSGGISTSALIERCVSEVRQRIGDLAWIFPSSTETSSQISSNADGKRWDGWVMPRLQIQGEETRTQFSCQYTPATNSITTEIIKP